MNMIKVAIVEDDSRFRQSLRRVIESGPGLTCIAEYATGAEAIERIPRDRPEVVLMDLNLPDFSGAEITARLKALLPDISVVVLTVYNDAEHIFKALRSGAGGYLLKQATASEILAAIAEVHHDDVGLAWPMQVAPFEVAVLPLSAKDAEVKATAEMLYGSLLDEGVEAVIDDRDVRPGVKFADVELVGIPFRVSVGARDLADGVVEITSRSTGEKERVPVGQAAERLRELVAR